MQSQPTRGFIAEWAVTFLLLLFGTTTLAQAFVIPTGSMEDTVLIGDHVLVDRLAWAPRDSVSAKLMPYEDIHRGDIIVFRYPPDIKQNYIKRAMGLPGDRIHIENKTVWLNGHPLNEPYAVHKTSFVDPYRDNFPINASPELRPEAHAMLEANVRNGELIVPPGTIFAMGDNRDNSDDSRYWGLVPRENIVGKPLLIYWSCDASTEALSDPSVNLSHLVDIALHFATKTRWNRTLRTLHGYPIQ
jgi:signal peptidase I